MTYTGAQQRYMKKSAAKKGQTSTPNVSMPFAMKKGSGGSKRRSSHRSRRSR